MTLNALRCIDGTEIPLDEVDPVTDWQRLGASPATIAAVVASRRKRVGLEDKFTASMIGKDTRQLLLERTRPFSMSLPEMMAAEMAVMDHSYVNVAGGRILANVRVQSRRFPWLSGELDNAVVVETLEEDGCAVHVLELFDLKRGGWYGAKLFAADPFAKDHASYAWQLNMLATLLEDATQADILAMGLRDKQMPTKLRVSRLWIESVPRDSSYRNEAEAQKLGIVSPHLFLVEVPRRPAEEVYELYETQYLKLKRAMEDDVAPICSDRWKDNVRCRKFCSVRDHCLWMAKRDSIPHPLEG